MAFFSGLFLTENRSNEIFLQTLAGLSGHIETLSWKELPSYGSESSAPELLFIEVPLSPDGEKSLPLLRRRYPEAVLIFWNPRGEAGPHQKREQEAASRSLETPLGGEDPNNRYLSSRELQEQFPALLRELALKQIRAGRNRSSGTKPVQTKAANTRKIKTRKESGRSAEHTNHTPPADRVPFLTGHSRSIQEVREQILLYAQTSFPVLITGESGTGKELAARALHRLSFTASKGSSPFVARNCSACPEGLFESEFFGVEEGAYTDARPRKGFFEAAAGGTLFLDEISDLPLSAQGKLLRVVEDGAIPHLGRNRTTRVRTRLVIASNRNLAQEVQKKKFRSDLFYRLNVLPLRLSPLRERKEDIPDLIEDFLKEMPLRKSFSREALALLTGYSWPGNIRELKNTVRLSAVLSRRNPSIKPENLRFSSFLPAENGSSAV